MARKFEDFENISMGNFVPFELGYHLLTITGHKEDKKENKKTGEIRDIDIFELTSDTGATTNLTLYYTPNAYWTYKKLMSVCGVKVDQLQGTQNLNMDNLIGRRFGAYVEMEAVEKWDETKGQMVTKRYPRINAAKIYTEEKAQELKATWVPPVETRTQAPSNTYNEPLGEPVVDEDMPF